MKELTLGSQFNRYILKGKDIIDFEKKFKIELPETYKKFLMKYNGVYFKENTIKDTAYEKSFYIENFFALKANREYRNILIEDCIYVMFRQKYINVNREFPKTWKNEKIEYLPIAGNGDGHGYFNISYLPETFGNIVLITGNDWDPHYNIANNFQEFIDKIIMDEE